MSSELERLSRSSRRVGVFWLIVTIGLTVYCLIGAFSYDPNMLHTWKGPALLLLCVGYLAWYVTWAWRHYHRPQMFVGAWLPFWRAFSRWGTIFGVICLMTALNAEMGWMFWAPFGMALGIFRFPRALLPAALSILGIFYALFALENPPPEAMLWIAISMGMGILSVGYTTYTSNRLMRERVEREHVFSDLEDAHRQLADAHRQLELSAEREAEMAVLSERSRLAREMHDTIGHALVLIAVKLEAAQRLRAVNPERADHEIDVTKDIVRSTMSEMRASVANLRSPTNAQQSIAEILARRARESSERAGFRVTYHLQSDLGEIGTPIREALYRIGAEALTNIEKHAQARAVLLSLICRDEIITLQIEDDGVGLPALVTAGQQATEVSPASPSSPAGHYGITGMRERAEALGGRLSISPRPGGGTIVEASIALSADAP